MIIIRKIIAVLMPISLIFTATVAVNAENGAILIKEQFQTALATAGSYEFKVDLEDMTNSGITADVKIDGKGRVLTYAEAYEKYYSSVSMMGDWSPSFMTRANDITISDEYVELKTNETKQLQAAVLPEGAADSRTSWSSSVPEIAAVDRTGKVTAVSKGEAVITASAVDGDYKAECVVTVTDGTDETGYPYEIDDILLELRQEKP